MSRTVARNRFDEAIEERKTQRALARMRANGEEKYTEEMSRKNFVNAANEAASIGCKDMEQKAARLGYRDRIMMESYFDAERVGDSHGLDEEDRKKEIISAYNKLKRDGNDEQAQRIRTDFAPIFRNEKVEIISLVRKVWK